MTSYTDYRRYCSNIRKAPMTRTEWNNLPTWRKREIERVVRSARHTTV